MLASFLKYLKYEKRVSQHTLTAYENDLKQFQQFISENFPDVQIGHADYSAVRSWIVSLVDSGLEQTSVNRKIATLRTFYKHLMRQEQIDKDPMIKIRVLKTKKKLPTFVKEQEIDITLDSPATPFDDTFEGWRNRLILEMLYATGMRLSELLDLRETRIDLRNNVVKVLGKRNKERIIPFPNSLVSIIEMYRKKRNQEIGKPEHDFFFVTSKGQRCYPVLINRIVKKYLQENTNTEKKSPHVLRHSYATHLLNKGAELNAVKDLLGHSSLAATQVYTHNSMEKLKKVFDQAHPKA